MEKDKGEKKEEKVYVCVVCGKKKKSDKKIECCGQDMLSEEKGYFNT